MALVLAKRQSLPGEPGEILVDCDIFRSGQKIRVKYYLTQTKKGYWCVTGGCKNGLELHSKDNEVLMSQITRPHYSHQLVATD